ncbi:XrtA/PEP-CTERM system TPR-repeat protein PrsT [Congregibacter sp.]|jgi:putative PEP-CTERM system TPR-repeat lipoprotein|uniref:XrtA/PEP-CTERM system TPR-repeat protein PrsT n=1 Tax=Congregibacter sp. TaxID=2744308 RepID=UPI0039E3B0C3
MLRTNGPKTARLMLLLQVCVALWLTEAGFATAQTAAEDYYEDAKRYYAEGKNAEAAIQLKNALSADDQHLPSLLLTGDLALVSGNVGAATAAFEEALLLGAAPALVLPKLADALLMAGRYQQLLNEMSYTDLPDRARAEVLGFHALAYLGLRNPSMAKLRVSAALQLNPDSRSALIAKIEILRLEGELEDAQSRSHRLVASYPNDARIWALHGSILSALGKLADAMTAYDKSLSLNDRLISARLGRASIHFSTDQFNSAMADVDYVRSNYPADPRGMFLKAQLLDSANRQAEALEEYGYCANQLSTVDEDVLASNRQLTLMAAIANSRTDSSEQAIQVLQAYQSSNATSTVTGTMLAGLLIEVDEGQKALAVMRPLLEENGDSRAFRMLMARTLSAAGNHEEARAIWQELQETGPGAIDMESLIALNELQSGASPASIRRLENNIASDPSREGDLYTIALAYIQTGDPESALPHALKLTELQPKNPDYNGVLGSAYLYTGDVDLARQAFKTAYDFHPEEPRFLLALVEADIYDGKLDSARSLQEQALELFPEDPLVILHQARLERYSGDLAEALRWAEKAYGYKPTTQASSELLIDILVELQDNTRAVGVARSVASKTDASFREQLLWASTLTRIGNPTDAITRYKLISRNQDLTHEQLYQIAAAQTRLKAFGDANATLYRVQRMAPTERAYKQASIVVALELGNYASALETAMALVREDPSDLPSLTLLAKAQSALGDFDSAASTLQNAFALTESRHRPTLIAWHNALAKAGRDNRALNVLDEWLVRNTNDAQVLYIRASYMIERSRYEEAKVDLIAASKIAPSNAMILNNLAYILVETDTLAAINTAQQAYKTAPQSPQVNHTLGWALVKNGQAKQGLPYLRQAQVLQANNAIVAFHLGVALFELNRPIEATQALENALQIDPNLQQRDEAKALLIRIATAESI